MKTYLALVLVALVTTLVVLSGCTSTSPSQSITSPSYRTSSPVEASTTSSSPITSTSGSNVVTSIPLSPSVSITSTGVKTSTPSTITKTTNTVGLVLDDSRAWPGYTLFAPKHYGSTYLINNMGQVVHTWTGSQYEPGQSAYLLENGNLMRAAMTKGPLSTGGGEGGRIEEYDWDSNLIWQLDFSTEKYMQHHDFIPLPNGNILLLAVEKKTYDEALAAGFNPSNLAQEIKTRGYMLPDAVYEIKPTRPVGGMIVWEWHVWDHMVQDFSSSRSNYGNVAAHPELIDPNGDGKNVPAFWNHMNSITYNAAFDQIMLSVRGNSEVWIIDHSTTSTQAAGHTGGKSGKGGDLLYRWGNPSQYRAGTQSDEKLFQQHNAIWIPGNYPGAGDIMVFNNGLGRNYSTVDQWTPPVDANGNYSLTGKAFGPTTFSWTYKANPATSLYDEAISGAQRLPNGNTLIDSGTHGRFIEVTSSGETVWEYINPVVKTGPLGNTEAIPADPARTGEFMNACFRVLRYGLDYPAFTGRDLTPKGTIER
jgi:hypothetical protein